MNVLLLSGPFDGRRDEWDAPVPYLERYYGKTKDFQSIRYDLRRYNLDSAGVESLVAVYDDVKDVIGDLISGYKVLDKITDKARATIIKAARQDFESGDTFNDIINHVIDDARNAR